MASAVRSDNAFCASAPSNFGSHLIQVRTNLSVDVERLRFRYRVQSRQGLISFSVGALSSVSLIIFFVAVSRGSNSLPLTLFGRVGTTAFSLALIALLLRGLQREAVCRCLDCGSPIRINSDSDLRINEKVVFCGRCQRYFQVRDTILDSIPNGFVAAKPIFRWRVSPESIFPGQCCICGLNASRVESYKFEKWAMIPQAPFPAIQTMGEIKIPYCGEHSDGAAITGDVPDCFVRFRSYSYFSTFCQVNLEPF